MSNSNISAALNIGEIFSINLTPEQREELVKKGTVNISFVEECLQAGRLYPKAVPDDKDINEFARDIVLYRELVQLNILLKNQTK